MISVCMDCGATVGIKCGKCGADTFLTPTRENPERRRCTRLSCNKKVDPTKCAKTGGLCGNCLAARMSTVGTKTCVAG